MGRKIEVHPGDKYGRLTVIKAVDRSVDPSGRKYRQMLCSCDCGSEPIKVLLNSLRKGDTKSCGCYKKEKTKERMKKFNAYDLETYEYGVGYTTKGEEFYFDKEDFELIKNYCWRISNGYVSTNVNNKPILMHRLVMNAKDGMEIDHIFHVTNDNRKSQLRECTRSQNDMNRKINKNNTIGVAGVYLDKRYDKWQARIGVNGNSISLGTFDTKEEAMETRLKAELELHGTFSPNYEKLTQQQSTQSSTNESTQSQ